MLQPRVTVDYSLFTEKMGKLDAKVIPYARVTAQQVARYGMKAVRVFTLRSGSRKGRLARTPGRVKIADLWRLAHSRRAYQDVYTIYNLYPNQDVIIFFEKGVKKHDIPPKNKEFLYWVDEETGEDVYTKKVVAHPGFPGTHAMERAEREIITPRMELWAIETFKMIDREMR